MRVTHAGMYTTRRGIARAACAAGVAAGWHQRTHAWPCAHTQRPLQSRASGSASWAQQQQTHTSNVAAGADVVGGSGAAPLGM